MELPESLKAYAPYTDDNGQIHTRLREAGFTNNGNLYTSWACVLALKATTSRDEQIRIARYWRNTILQSEVAEGIFARGVGATIPNSHDDYRGIAFASYFCDGGTTAKRIYQAGLINVGIYVDQESFGFEALLAQFLFRFPDFVLTLRLAAGRPVTLLDRLVAGFYLYRNSRTNPGEQGQWFWGSMVYALLYERGVVESSWFIRKAHERFRLRFLKRWPNGIRSLWFEYTTDQNFPLSQAITYEDNHGSKKSSS